MSVMFYKYNDFESWPKLS